MLSREINFDRFVRGLIVAGGLVAAYFLLSYLSSVLIPFFVAWVAAYMLYPVVCFLQYKCGLRSRLLCTFLVLLAVVGTVTGAVILALPTFTEQVEHVKTVAQRYIEQGADNQTIPSVVQEFARKYASEWQIDRFLEHQNLEEIIRNTVPKVWDVLWSTAGIILNFVGSLIGLLYFFFLLLDYEKYANGWIYFVPKKRRAFAQQLVDDVVRGMSGYFRGQALVALSNCVMFSVGFVLIGFPMPIVLGTFIGVISFIPYVQVIGILPAAVLALLKAADTGQNFWILLGGVLLVYLVVQVLQDSIVTPHVMGKIMGLSPAIILLSLTVWGYALGIIGLIIALPVTTLVVSYYRHYVIGDEDVAEDDSAVLAAVQMDKAGENGKKTSDARKN